MMTETQVKQLGIARVQEIKVIAHGESTYTVELCLTRRGWVGLTTRRGEMQPKIFVHRARLLARLARLFPHVAVATIEQARPVSLVELASFRAKPRNGKVAGRHRGVKAAH